MNEYEITYLANPKLDEKAKEALDQAVDAEINQLEGEVSYSSAIDAPGAKRRLHYPIHDEKSAWVRTIQGRFDQQKIEQLRSFLRKTENVMRVSVLQTPKREEVSAAIFDPVEQPKEVKPTTKDSEPAKEVTQEEVDKGIEEALDEEVK